MNGATSNTSGENQAKFRMKPAATGDRLPTWLAEELVRRGFVVLDFRLESNIVIQPLEPEDKTKVWFLSDPNGIPIGSAQVYNALTGKWGPADQGIAPYVPPLTRYGSVSLSAGAGSQTISYESVKTNNVFVTLTPTTRQPDGSFNASAVAPVLGGSTFYVVVTEATDTTATIDHYAVPSGGLTFDWKVEAIPS